MANIKELTKEQLFVASVYCPKCGKQMGMRVNQNRDYAIANEAYKSTSANRDGCGDWWTRTLNEDTKYELERTRESPSVVNIDRRGRVENELPFANYIDDNAVGIRLMIMMRKYDFRFLSGDDIEALNSLIEIIEEKIDDRAWWLDIKPEARKHFLDDTWTLFYGAFDGDKLIAACGLFLNEFEYGESADKLGVSRDCCAEIGRCMVDPKYRGEGLMLDINKTLVEEAKLRGIKNIIATAHPKNTYSCNSLKQLGMQVKIENIEKDKCLRNIFLMTI